MKRYYRWCKECDRVTEHHKEFPDMLGKTSCFCLTCQPYVKYVDVFHVDPTVFEYLQRRKEKYENM